jgi:hypothetical protein
MNGSRIQLVKQLGNNDCGIACAAMVANVSYDVAVLTFLSLYPNEYPETEGKINITIDKIPYVFDDIIINTIRTPLNQRMLDNLLRHLNVNPIRGEHEIYGELLPDNLYIMAVLSHGRTGHFIVVDTRCNPFEIYDPVFGRKKKYSIKNPPLAWAGLVKIQYI